MNKNRVVTNERVDDLPLLLARQGEMGVARLIDKHFVPHGNWQGASLGEIIIVWLTFILSEGDHRLNQVEEWFGKRCETIRHYAHAELTTNDFRDDRLAILLRELSDDERWSSFESELNRHSIRVYDLSSEPGTPWVRLDATTVSGHWQVTEDGMFQYGHSKDHRPDLPQLKVMLSTLDPLGMPLVTTVVSGNRADDPLYVPAIMAVRQSLKKSGLLYIGDVKMAAIGTRTMVQGQEDYYLCPLSEVQLPREKMLDLIAPALQDPSLLVKVERTQADGKCVHIADAFERQIEQSGDIDGETVIWRERQIFTRSIQYALSQTKSLHRRLHLAQEEIAALHERKQGKPRLQTRAEFQMAVENILQRRRVAGLLHIEYETTVHERRLRKDGDRPPFWPRSTK
jgi:transposase